MLVLDSGVVRLTCLLVSILYIHTSRGFAAMQVWAVPEFPELSSLGRLMNARVLCVLSAYACPACICMSRSETGNCVEVGAGIWGLEYGSARS